MHLETGNLDHQRMKTFSRIRILDSALLVALAAGVGACRESPSTAPDETERVQVRWVSVAAAGFAFTSFTCGLTDTNTAYCWGSNGSGELGVAGIDEARSPVSVAEGIVIGQLLLCAAPTASRAKRQGCCRQPVLARRC
jgi:hypothetical protein